MFKNLRCRVTSEGDNHVQAVYYILFAIVLLFSLYFVLLALFAFIKGKSPIKTHDAKTKFAVLIAARNEAEVIGDLIESLKVQKYPDELYDIYALVNNCTDQTEQVARAVNPISDWIFALIGVLTAGIGIYATRQK